MDNQKAAEKNMKLLENSNLEKIDCSEFPDNEIYEQNKKSTLDYIADGWAVIKFIGVNCFEGLSKKGGEFEALKKRIFEFLPVLTEEFLSNMITVFSSFVPKIISFFVEKGLSLIWWIVKVLYYIYKAINSNVDESAFDYWGKAVGGSIRIIYSSWFAENKFNWKKEIGNK